MPVFAGPGFTAHNKMSDNQIRASGTPAQKQAMAARRKKAQEAKNAEVVPEAPSQADGAGPEPAAEPSVEGDLEAERDADRAEIQKLRKERDELKATIEDLYGKCSDKDASITELEQKYQKARADTTSARKEHSGLNSNINELEREVRLLEHDKSTIQAQYRDTKRELAGFKANKSKVQEWNMKLQEEHDDLLQQYRKIRDESDTKSSDLMKAHQEIDKLTSRLEAQAGEEIDKARAYMQHISEALDPVFEEQGKDLTPDSFRDHFDRITQQANLNRHASGTSLSSLQEPSLKRNDSGGDDGVRKLSLGDELLNHDDSAFESDEEGIANLDETLRLPKQRKRSSLHFQDIESKLSDKEQEINKQREHIQKLEAEALKLSDKEQEINKQREHIQKLEEEALKLSDKEQEINKQREHIQKLEEEALKQQQAAKEHEQKSAKLEKDVSDYHEICVKQALAIKDHENALQLERNKHVKPRWSRYRHAVEDEPESDTPEADAEANTVPLTNGEQNISEKKTIDENSNADQKMAVHPMIRYHEKVRDTTIWEAIMRAPWWQKLFLAFLIMLCVSVYARGIIIAQSWENANSRIAEGFQHVGDHFAQVSWRTWLEDYVEYDSSRLG